MYRVVSATAFVLCLFAAALPGSARASGFFGLFGSSEKTPAPSRDALPYALDFGVDDNALLRALQDASELYRLRLEAPPDGETLARRVAADLPRLVDALWSEGYYNADIHATVAGQSIDLNGGGIEAASAAAERSRGTARVPVRIAVTPGPRFRLGEVRVVDAGTGQPFAPDLFSPEVLKLGPGDFARAGAVQDAALRVVDALRAKSHPLAHVVKILPTVRHREAIVDLVITVDPGKRAGIGRIDVSGTRDLDPAVVRSFIYAQEGDPYSPAKIAALRKAISGGIEAVGSVRVLESDHLDTSGYLPIQVDVGERPKHAVSIGAQYSTIDGP
jgi:translocation and assembly module TamA